MPVIVDYYSKPPFGTKINLTRGISQNMTNAFLLNETGGSYVYDSATGLQGTIYDKNGTLQGNNSAVTRLITPYGLGLEITNSNGSQFGPFPNPFTASGKSFSLAFFARPGATGTNRAIWGTGGGGMEVRLNTTDKLDFLHSTVADLGSGTTSFTGSSTIDNSNWQQGAISYDGNNIAFYYNGAPDGTATNTATFTNTQAQAIFGPGITSPPPNEVFNINSVFIYIYIWNRVITAQEVRDLYASPFIPFEKKLYGYKISFGSLPFTESLSDTLSLSDLIALNVQPAFSLSDQIILTDSVLGPGGVPISLGVGDTFVFNDANSQVIQLLGVLTAVLSDQISLSDAESNAIPIDLTIKDNRAKLSLSDSVLRALKQLVQLNDTLTLTDLVQDVLMPIANLQPSDTFAFTDAVVTNLASIFSPIFLNFADQLAINDLNLILKSPDYLSVVDTLNLQDSVIVSLITDLNPYIRRYLNDVLSISNPTPSSGGGGAQTGTGGSGGTGGVLFYDDIVPSGLIDGNNTNFSLPSAPNPPSSLELFLSGVLQIPGTDYTLVGSTIVFTTAPHIGSTIVAFYRG